MGEEIQVQAFVSSELNGVGGSFQASTAVSSRERLLLPNDVEAKWEPGPSWMLWRREEPLVCTTDCSRSPDFSTW
jgi:hypothetical protein